MKSRTACVFLASSAFFLILFFFLIQVLTRHPPRYNVLTLNKKANMIYESSSESKIWTIRNLIDRRRTRGWRSMKNSPFPHEAVFELALPAHVDLLKFNNKTREDEFPGISTKEIQVEFSTSRADSGYRNIGSFILKQGVESQEFSIEKTEARWIRLTLLSNYGDPLYTEISEFEAWGTFEHDLLEIIRNLLWILGLAIIFASLSYHEYAVHTGKAEKTEILKSPALRKTLLYGSILVAAGISFSIHKIWLASLFAVVALLLMWFLFKLQRTRPAEKKDVPA